MAYHRLPAAGTLAAIVLAAFVAGAAGKKGRACRDDSDCKAGRVCYDQRCTRLDNAESLLRVVLAQPQKEPAVLYVDGMEMGRLPWEGIVQAGSHTIRVESYGKLPVSFQGESRASKADELVVELEPDPALYAPPQQPAPQPVAPPATGESGGGESPGRVQIGLFGAAGYGTASYGSGTMRPATALRGGLTAGVTAVTDPAWLDVGVTLSSVTHYIVDLSEDWGELFKINAGVILRLMFPIKENFFYIGAQLEPGMTVVSNHLWAYGRLHGAMSLFVTEWLELRIDPVGFDFAQDLKMDGYLATFDAGCAAVFRFVDF
ncbi:MAG: hypothetical protein R6V85_08880 [Polyangia bacterium]